MQVILCLISVFVLFTFCYYHLPFFCIINVFLLVVFNLLTLCFRELGECIKKLCQRFVRTHSDLHHWLLAVPLVHFLTGQSQPFDKSLLLLEKPKQQQQDEWWGAQGFETKAVRRKAHYHEGRFVFAGKIKQVKNWLGNRPYAN